MARSFAINKDVIFVQKRGIMGYIHCCGGIRKAKSYALRPQRGYLYAQVDLLQECPVCSHTVVQITRMDLNNNVSVCRKINDKARKLFDKIKSEILYEKDKYKFVTNPTSKFYLYYNEFGIKKKCYSNISSLKLGLFENGKEFSNNQLKIHSTHYPK